MSEDEEITTTATDAAAPVNGVEVESWAVELDDETDDVAIEADTELGEAVVVDPGAPIGPDISTGVTPDGRREVIPSWLKDQTQRKDVVRHAASGAWHTTKYHSAHSPVYAGRLVARSPVGLARITGHVFRWAADSESRDVRAATAKAAEAGEFLRVQNQHRELVRNRLILLAVVATLVMLLASGVVLMAPTPVKLLIVAVVLGVLGAVGRHADKPVIDHAVVTPRVRKLSADVVTRAFVAARMCKADDPITFPSPIMRDGPGWRAFVDLPFNGKTAEDVIKNRTALAAGLDLDEVQVWPERVRGTSGSARRLSLWVADEDPYAKPSGKWPAVSTPATTSVFNAFAFGQDQRGRPVEMSLMFTWLLVAATPRMGKTFAARLPVMTAALDPYTQLHVYDGKGAADWRAFAKVAHRYGIGVVDDVVKSLLEDLRELKTEMDRRYGVLSKLSTARCPEGKITPELAKDPALGLRPIVISIDEFQRYAQHGTHGDEIVNLLTELAKVGPAAGIMGVLATQKPDPDSIPTRLRDVIGTRFCLAVKTWQSSDAALGSGSYSAGYDASRFQRAHKGVGWLLGADDDAAVEEAVTVRTFLAEHEDAERIIDFARAARDEAGTLTGHAIGEQPDRAPEVNVAADVRAVFGGDTKLWNETILARLVHHRPGFYAGWGPAQLTTGLKPYNVPVTQVWANDASTGKGANRRGITRTDLDAALAAWTAVHGHPDKEITE